MHAPPSGPPLGSLPPTAGPIDPVLQLLERLTSAQIDSTKRFVTVQENTTQLLTQNQTNNARPATDRKKTAIAKPKVYDGTFEGFDAFIAQLKMYFQTKAYEYENDVHDQAKITDALLLMQEGRAAKWAELIYGEMELAKSQGRLTFSDWGVFERRLRSYFEDPNKKEKAQHDLHTIRQKPGEAMIDFLARFDQLQFQAGFSDEDLLAILREAVEPGLFYSALINASGVERNLPTWKQRLLEMDNKRRTWRMEHQSSDRSDARGEGRDRGGYGRGRFSNRRGNWNQRGVAPLRGPVQMSERVPSAPPVPSTSSTTIPAPAQANTGARTVVDQGEPMDVDRARNRRVQGGRCWTCQAQGHFSNQCPQRMARQMWDDMGDEERQALVRVLTQTDEEAPKEQPSQNEEVRDEEEVVAQNDDANF
ncbi:hypothetical protein M378DRAFT_163316 [Amanita muscaria Koide BX008]|uniref:CCHC-type domain-containing protein n=1 Tax=Amanita muscaria (strain Koide BX008) TaxID=946122 RepID=A0A0C2WRJ3_AMAMK|nr:hypothetical protein M378DRAFT_163316 [Amanita muscaria Koide BX008]